VGEDGCVCVSAEEGFVWVDGEVRGRGEVLLRYMVCGVVLAMAEVRAEASLWDRCRL